MLKTGDKVTPKHRDECKNRSRATYLLQMGSYYNKVYTVESLKDLGYYTFKECKFKWVWHNSWLIKLGSKWDMLVEKMKKE